MRKNKAYSCIVVDDEANAIANMKEYINELSEFKLIKSYSDPAKVLKEILAGEKVDLILMDVDMPMINGVELAKAIRHKTDKLIFTTAHSKYAFDAFEVSANAFLLKPITFAKFAATLHKFFPPLKANDEDFENEDYFFVKNTDDHLKVEKIKFEDIIAIESVLNYIKIHTLAQKIITYQSLLSMKKFLSFRPEFMQVQRSFIISAAYIENLDRNVITLQNGMKITIGDRYKQEVLNFIKSNTMKSVKY